VKQGYLVERVRAALAQGEAPADEVAERLGVQSYKGRKKVRQALYELVRRGEVEVVRPPSRYRLAAPVKVRARKQERVWRALQVKAAKGEGATVREICRLAGTCRDYTGRYIRHLARLGLVERGRGRANAAVWRIRPGREQEAAPRWSRLKEEGKA